MNAVCLVQVHHLGTEIASLAGLNIVSENDASGMTLGPEPDKRDLLEGTGAQDGEQDRFKKLIYTAIHRPLRKFAGMTIPEEGTLLQPAQDGGQVRAQ